MLKIRLQRVGRKHEPTFRLVLTDSKNSTKSGRYLESLGNYDSRRGESASFKDERIKHWISKGAQLSGTVNNLLISNKIISGKKINVLPLKKPIKKESDQKNEQVKNTETETAKTEGSPVVETVPVSETEVSS